MRWLQFKRRDPGRRRLNTLLVWTFVERLVCLWLRLGYRYRCSGREHVPPHGPVIFASGHQSHLDPLIVGVLVHDRPSASMARASLFEPFFFGALLRFMGAVPIQRGRGDSGAVRTAIGILEGGRTLLVFPEGTRTRDGRTAPMRGGAALLAQRSGAPIIPIAVEGARDVWPYGRSRPRLRGWIAAKAGPAIPVEELVDADGERDLEPLRRRIETMRLELREEIRERTRGRAPAPGEGDRPYWE
jgi:1-acyl-sn-glycerol-3-phosphate acyltransferase